MTGTKPCANPGFDGREKTFLPASKAPAFKAVFNIIKREVGGYEEAVKFAGLSNGTMDNLNKGRLSKDSAKKIMSAYGKLKKI